MSRSKSGKIQILERAYKILAYLMRNTDEDHRTTSGKIAAELNDESLSTDTRNDIILSLANILNCDNDDHTKSEDEWRIVFDWYRNTYLYDWFGDKFQYVREDKGYDIVNVQCSPFGMANWAMQ